MNYHLHYISIGSSIRNDWHIVGDFSWYNHDRKRGIFAHEEVMIIRGYVA